MCPCNVEKFHEEQNEFVRKTHDFWCQYNDNHFVFVYTCKDHPLIVPKDPEMASTCSCDVLGPDQIFNFVFALYTYLILGRLKFVLKNT